MTAQTERLNTALDGRYRIIRHLGEGGMATVYLCEDLKHDRQVALKLLKPELAAVLGAERFVQEIKTTAALQHTVRGRSRSCASRGPRWRSTRRTRSLVGRRPMAECIA